MDTFHLSPTIVHGNVAVKSVAVTCTARIVLLTTFRFLSVGLFVLNCPATLLRFDFFLKKKIKYIFLCLSVCLAMPIR